MDKLGILAVLSTKSEKQNTKSTNAKKESLKGLTSNVDKNGVLFKNLVAKKTSEKLEKTAKKESSDLPELNSKNREPQLAKSLNNQTNEKIVLKQENFSTVAENESVKTEENKMPVVKKSESEKINRELKTASSSYEKTDSKEVEKKEKKYQENSIKSETAAVYYSNTEIIKNKEISLNQAVVETKPNTIAVESTEVKNQTFSLNTGIKQYGLTKIEEKKSYSEGNAKIEEKKSSSEVNSKIEEKKNSFEGNSKISEKTGEKQSELPKVKSEVKLTDLNSNKTAEKTESLITVAEEVKKNLVNESKLTAVDNGNKEVNKNIISNNFESKSQKENGLNEKYALKDMVEELVKKGSAEITVSKFENRVEMKSQPRNDIKQIEISTAKEKSEGQQVLKENLQSFEQLPKDKKTIQEEKYSDKEMKKENNVAAVQENLKEKPQLVKNEIETKHSATHLNVEMEKAGKTDFEYDKRDLKEMSVKEDIEIKKGSHFKESIAETKPKEETNLKTEHTAEKNSDISDKNFAVNSQTAFGNNRLNDEMVIKPQENQVVHKNVNSESMYSQVDSFIKMNFNPETREMKMRLTPDDLGEVEVKINIEKNIMIAEFTVESQRVKEVLESRFNELKNNLNEKGIEVSQINVSISNGDSGNRQEQRFAWDEMQEMRKMSSSNKAENKDYSKINEAAVSYYNNKSSTGINILY